MGAVAEGQEAPDAWRPAVRAVAELAGVSDTSDTSDTLFKTIVWWVSPVRSIARSIAERVNAEAHTVGLTAADPNGPYSTTNGVTRNLQYGEVPRRSSSQRT